MRELASIDPALVQGYLANDPEAIVLISVVAANADLGSIGITPDSASVASYVNPLQDVTVEDGRTLLFEIRAIDPYTGEVHSFRSPDESLWRTAINGLMHKEWSYQLGISVVIDETGGPRSFASHSPHIRAA